MLNTVPASARACCSDVSAPGGVVELMLGIAAEHDQAQRGTGWTAADEISAGFVVMIDFCDEYCSLRAIFR